MGVLVVVRLAVQRLLIVARGQQIGVLLIGLVAQIRIGLRRPGQIDLRQHPLSPRRDAPGRAHHQQDQHQDQRHDAPDVPLEEAAGLRLLVVEGIFVAAVGIVVAIVHVVRVVLVAAVHEDVVHVHLLDGNVGVGAAAAVVLRARGRAAALRRRRRLRHVLHLGHRLRLRFRLRLRHRLVLRIRRVKVEAQRLKLLLRHLLRHGRLFRPLQRIEEAG